MRITLHIAILAVVGASAAGCGGDGASAAPSRSGQGSGSEGVERAAVERALGETLERAHALSDSIEDILRPVALLRPAEEAALKRYGNAVQLARARQLGVRPIDAEQIETLVREGRLVRLEDSTEHWVVRELTASRPFVTPDVPVLLERLGRAFQQRIAALGLPPYRLEVTSVLRTAADQAALRRENVNAAAGTSTHEYGTTIDIAYTAFPPPAELPDGVVADAPEWLRPYLEQVARSVMESVSARKSLELKAVLGHVLREAQADGIVMVTLEELQPVYHMTVARRLAGS